MSSLQIDTHDLPIQTDRHPPSHSPTIDRHPDIDPSIHPFVRRRQTTKPFPSPSLLHPSSLRVCLSVCLSERLSGLNQSVSQSGVACSALTNSSISHSLTHSGRNAGSQSVSHGKTTHNTTQHAAGSQAGSSMNASLHTTHSVSQSVSPGVVSASSGSRYIPVATHDSPSVLQVTTHRQSPAAGANTATQPAAKCVYVCTCLHTSDDGTDRCLRQTGAPTVSFLCRSYTHQHTTQPASRCRENYDGRPAPSPLVHLSILLSSACASLRRACVSVLSVEKGIAPERGGAGRGRAGSTRNHPSIHLQEGGCAKMGETLFCQVNLYHGQLSRRGRQIGRERQREGGREGRVGAGRTATFLAPSPSLPVRGHDET